MVGRYYVLGRTIERRDHGEDVSAGTRREEKPSVHHARVEEECDIAVHTVVRLEVLRDRTRGHQRIVA